VPYAPRKTLLCALISMGRELQSQSRALAGYLL